jgi:hypothetical protein
MNTKVYFIFPLFLLLFVEAVIGQKPLTNGDILEMVKSGFEVETIIKAVEANQPAFDTSVQGLLALKNGGVSEKIISAILSASSRKTEAVPSSTQPKGPPEEIGVYVKSQDKLVAVEPEIVTWRTGGFLKTQLTMGLNKGHVNGTVSNSNSKLKLSPPLEFVIICAEGTSAAEYQLLRLDQKGNRREFRTMTGGVIHASGGADRNAVAFEHEKIAARTYKIELADLKAGEYGLLPPGAMMSASVASSGKIYTFRIPE